MTDLREVLFGDVPTETWAASGTGAPWDDFRVVADSLARGDQGSATSVLKKVLATPDLESRHYAQAWSGLRALGVAPPPAEATRVLGVVVDVPLSGGRDTLAAYEDGSARYLNFSGAGVVWDAPGADSEVDESVARLIAAARELAVRIGIWEGPRPPLQPHSARISLLTPGGLRFGEGPLDALSRDPLAAPVFEAGAALMQLLTGRASAKRS